MKLKTNSKPTTQVVSRIAAIVALVLSVTASLWGVRKYCVHFQRQQRR